jgi:hypothetical protein
VFESEIRFYLSDNTNENVSRIVFHLLKLLSNDEM